MEKVDVIVVGGGLAGLSAAYGLAAEGLEVILIERGDYSGAKNVTGGRLYVSPIRHMYPELWESAPFERPVTREFITLMGEGNSTTIEFAADKFAAEPYQSYTVLRATFDLWLSEQVMEKGGMVIVKQRVDELIKEDDRVVGIRAGEDEIGADVTIIAEGVLGLVSTKAGLRDIPSWKDHAVGFKETLELPKEVIESRWHLAPDEGAAHLFMGGVTKGMLGGGFLYTNKESISFGIVLGMKDAKERVDKVDIYTLLDDFKANPAIAPLVAGGELVEYSAHVISEAGLSGIPKLWGDGYLMTGDAAGLALNQLYTVRGMDFAVASGYYAAQAIIEAKKQNDLDAAGPAYEKMLKDSWALKDFETAKNIPHFIENPRIFSHYPNAVGRLFDRVFTLTDQPTDSIYTKVMSSVKKDFMNATTVKEMLGIRKI